MSPAKRRRLPSTGAAASVGFSPFLRSLSRLPPPKAPSSAAAPPRERSSASLGRRRRRPCEEENLTSSDDDEDEEEDYVEETVQVDFGFFDPKPGDFHGVKLLLKTYLDDRDWDLSGFVDVILQQTTVGTVVKSDDGDGGGEGDSDGLYAVISALNLGRYANLKCIKDVKDYVFGMCPKDLQEELRSLLEDQARDVALLICERFVNYPDQAVPPLHNGLFDEIGWATEDEPTQEIRDCFHFKFYLLITKLYVNKVASKKKTGSNGSDSNQSVVYIKSEDEIFRKLSSISFTFDLHYGHVVPHEMKGYKKMGLAMVVKSEHVPAIRRQINLLSS